MQSLTIVIPVYNAASRLRACLDSIFRHTELCEETELLLIDDAGGEAALEPIFASLPNRYIRLIRHDRNIGYTGSINEGIRLAQKRDVVLLNSDVIVTPDWLRLLRKHAQSGPSIGTITPVSNNAGEFSVPEPNENYLPPELDIDGMALLTRQCADGEIFDVPTGNGFCMYIRRELINAIGLFDEINFKEGFGEENDFCMRGYYAGFRNLVALDVYVWHAGHASFGERYARLTNMARHKLKALYPDYFTLVKIFRQDPVFQKVRDRIRQRLGCYTSAVPPLPPRPEQPDIGRAALRTFSIIRNYCQQYGLQQTAQKIAKNIWKAIDKKNMAMPLAKIEEMHTQICAAEPDNLDSMQASKDRIMNFLGRNSSCACIIDHRWGGGANLYSGKKISELTAKGQNVMCIAHAGNCSFVYVIFYAASARLVLCVKSLEEALTAPWLAISGIFINELVLWDGPDNGRDVCEAMANVTGTILKCAQTRHIPIQMPVHDFYCICPSYNLLGENGKFCELPDAAECKKCIKRIFSKKRERIDIKRWRKIFYNFMCHVDRIICFSDSSAAIVKKIYPQLSPKISIEPHAPLIEWEQPCYLPNSGPITAAVIGSISQSKGLEIIKQMPALLKNGEKLVIIGSCDEFEHCGNVIFHGPYQRESLPRLLQAYGVNIALIPSVWPETFCYVAQECEKLGLPLVTFDLGAQAERAKKYKYGLSVSPVSADSAYKAMTALHEQLKKQMRRNQVK